MINTAITTPSLQINGIYIKIVPNSLEYKRGFGNADVKAQSIGATVVPVYERNQEEAIGYLTFHVYAVSDIINHIQEFQDNNPSNTVQFVDPNGGLSKTMSSAAITADPQYTLGADKTIAIEMKGTEIV